jgi:molybdopterin-guanine dinucleotide biosynthesis protein A
MLAHAIERARPQVAALALNANGDPARFAAFGLAVVPDTIPDFAGPLAGVLAGMEWARRAVPGAEWLASFATDAPLFPASLVADLLAATRREGADMACARSGGQAHPVFGLWPIGLAGELERAMREERVRKVDAWTGRYRLAVADYPAQPFDPFFNANTPAELAEAERLLS